MHAERLMKVFEIDGAFLQGDSVFKDLQPSGYKDWYSESRAQMALGESLKMSWASDSHAKPGSDYILLPVSGIAARTLVIDSFTNYAPESTVVQMAVVGEFDSFALLRPKNYKSDAVQLDHIFMMFSKFKRVLVTEKFKDAWEAKALTGAVFEQVADFSDARFKPLAE